MIQSYFGKLRNKVKELSALIKTENVSFDMVSAAMGIVKGRIVFIDGSTFDFREIVSRADHDYRFHWMDRNARLIIRWDSAPHHGELDNYPFHKHEGKKVSSSGEIYLTDALDYIKKAVIHNLFKK